MVNEPLVEGHFCTICSGTILEAEIFKCQFETFFHANQHLGEVGPITWASTLELRGMSDSRCPM